MDLQNFLLFALASFILNITPGADMLYVATRSTGQGIKAGVISSLGVMVGCIAHATAAVVGLSAIIASSATAFTIIKYAGAAYLIYLGIRSFLSKDNSFSIAENSEKLPDRKIFMQGAITNVLNPKVALFFLAFLPQFVDPKSDSPALTILLLGIWFTISGTIVNIAIAIIFGKMGNWLANKEWFVRWQNKITGVLLFALGLKIALTKK
jgi:threonine/homoserine/homoserine lactone efflux protein